MNEILEDIIWHIKRPFRKLQDKALEKQYKRADIIDTRLKEKELYECLNVDISDWFDGFEIGYPAILRREDNANCCATYYLNLGNYLAVDKEEWPDKLEVYHVHADQYSWSLKHYDEVLEDIKTTIRPLAFKPGFKPYFKQGANK